MNEKWEYAAGEVYLDTDGLSLREDGVKISFTHFGERGWELVTITKIMGKSFAFFKRRTGSVTRVVVETNYDGEFVIRNAGDRLRT